MGALLLVWPGAIAIGLSLGLLGSGGSILTVPVLVYLAGQEEKVAIAGSLAIVGLIALAAVIPYLRRGLVDWRSVMLFGIPGMIGTYGGAWGSAFVSGTVQLAGFAVVMLLAAGLMLRNSNPVCATPTLRREAAWKVISEGLVVGVVTGFVGVGGGFLVVPALVLLGGLTMQQAVPTSLVIIAIKSFVGFWKYTEVIAAEHLSLDPVIILAVAAVGVIGSWIGSAVAFRLPQEVLKRAFGVFLVVMGGLILVQSSVNLLAA